MKSRTAIPYRQFSTEDPYVSWPTIWASYFGSKEVPSWYYDSGAEGAFVRDRFLTKDHTHVIYESISVGSDEHVNTRIHLDKKKRALLFADDRHGVKLLIPASSVSDVQAFRTLCQEAPRYIKEPKPHIYIPVPENGSLRLRRFDIELEQTQDILDYYNDDFAPVHDRLMQRLGEENGRGVAILHGPPGTGKTSYIRYLSGQFITKKVVYIPQDLGGWLSTPEAMKFLMDIPNSILIIEDAEEMLRPRKNGNGRSAVSTLLNMTDGLLADCLSIQVVCTFNDSLSSIDEALLRPGRLIAQYEFGALSKDRAGALARSHGIAEPTNGCTLAELFADEPIVAQQERRIGFVAKAAPDQLIGYTFRA